MLYFNAIFHKQLTFEHLNKLIAMIPKLARISILALLCFTLVTCNKNDDVVPYVFVNLSINLSDPQFIDLQAVGNAVKITGGVRGIVVYRKSIDEFLAYDRNCTYKASNDSARVDIEKSLGFAFCEHCGSQFSLVFEGTVLKGPASRQLLLYRTSYNRTFNTLYISNFQ